MHIEYIKVTDLKPYKNNPRKNKNGVQYVKASIKEFGFKVPLVIDTNNEIICGHTRLLAAKELDMAEVPCIRADDLTQEQVKAFRIADNKVAEYTEWDTDILKIELGDILNTDYDIGMTGFSMSSVDELLHIDDNTIHDVNTDNDKGDENTKTKKTNTLKWGKYKLVMTDDELEELSKKYIKYTKDKGSSFGFVANLLGGIM